ncbi:peptidase S10, serine carboxypeptidase, Alpha/Beta hydrolase fold protein [Artemisia annua]|uniref:Peptidase S10, serine carboxypeptidase, Alpha/Beta hydrolase fold protein n=1 Tax=Artemisia annua TaxID=35608 RepID=A0A2U1LKU6_ARTAN|nr:peptidase S10, serine carboxypeptidase, Alpha/Beta hydrolase fold protein [Artemisia annua]
MHIEKQNTSSLVTMSTLFLVFIVLLCSSTLIASQTIVKALPGYPGPLPFKLETGYIGVGANESVQLFYYFVESEGNPEEDPLIVWLAGGPGCGSLRAFFYEIGPMQIQYGNYMDNVPALALDPNSWTKVANVIYLDAPALTGYSYTTNPESVRSSDTKSALQTAEFLRKFVRDHPKFLKNPIYVTGISYSGIVIPIITEELYKGNDEGLEPFVNIQGYMGANPLTDKTGDINSRLEFAYRVALIPVELYEATTKDCNGDYAEADSNNLQCMLDINEVNKRVGPINMQQILDPDCEQASNLVRGGNPVTMGNRRTLRADPIKMLPARSTLKDTFCRGDYYNYATLWANDENVMKTLGVREGTVKEWLLCNLDMNYIYGITSMPQYEFNVRSSVAYHERLTKRNCRALIFSGDHDMTIPHVGTRTWINSLNLTITTDNWAAWYVNGQAAGYKTTYARDNYTLAFATVKGAGHTAPEFNPAECFELAKRWFANKPI